MRVFQPHTGGHPRSNDDIMFVQQAVFDGFLGLSKVFGDTYIISGCAIPNPSTGNYTIAAGWMCYQGEIMEVAGNSITGSASVPSITVDQVAAAPSPVTYFDAVSRNAHFTRKAKLITSQTAGFGDTIITSIGNWDASIWALNNTIGYQTIGSGSPAPAYLNSWAGYSGNGYEELKVRVNKFNQLELVGACYLNSGSRGDKRLFVLNSTQRPAARRTINVPQTGNPANTPIYQAVIDIKTNGDVVLEPFYPDLGGVSFSQTDWYVMFNHIIPLHL